MFVVDVVPGAEVVGLVVVVRAADVVVIWPSAGTVTNSMATVCTQQNYWLWLCWLWP